MRIDILTLFPEMCESVMSESIIGRAQKSGKLRVICHNIRDYTPDKHRRVDDYPYGGGPGMILQSEPISRCFEAICEQTDSRPYFIYMSPGGRVFTQQKAAELAGREHIAILCGHYEGVDQRVIDELADEEISVGDYVLTGGELPALVLADAVARLVPGVLAEEQSYEKESHFSGLLEHPQYTRPAVWRGREVPEVLQNGHHKNIEAWARDQSLRKTLERRPDMLRDAPLSRGDIARIEEILAEFAEPGQKIPE